MDALLHIAIAQFVFAALLALFRRRRQLSDYVLACWLVLMGIFMVLTLLKIKLPDSRWAELQLFPFFFTLGPFLYLYVRTLTAKVPKLDFADGLHLLPFVIFSVTAVTLNSGVDEDILEGNSFHLNRLPYSLSALLSIAIYLPATIRQLNRHQKNLLEFFSYTSDRISLNWLRMVVIGFSVMFGLTIVSALVNVGTGANTVHPGYFLFTGFALFAFGFSFFGLQQPVIFSRSADARFVDELEDVEDVFATTSAPTEKEHPEKYSRSSLTDEAARELLGRLDVYLREEKPFLHRDLTLQEVAQAIGVPQHHLTQAINAHLQKNFYTLVNEHRLEEVKRRLLDRQYAHLTVLAIAHDAGFNSKSSFNMTFKKLVGMTPSQYRDQRMVGNDR